METGESLLSSPPPRFHLPCGVPLIACMDTQPRPLNVYLDRFPCLHSPVPLNPVHAHTHLRTSAGQSRATWKRQHPETAQLPGEYSSGVKLSTKEMEPSEARLERSATLPKYDITIRPKSQPAAVVWFLPLA